MTLPATYEEAQTALLKAKAVEFARDFLRRFKTDPMPLPLFLGPGATPVFPLDRIDGVRWAKECLKSAAVNEQSAEHVCTLARNGWGLAQDALDEVITAKQQRGEELSTSLAAYDIAHRKGLVRNGGPEKASLFLRDIILGGDVWEVCEQFRLFPLRSKRASASNLVSGCLVVAEAWNAEKEDPSSLTEDGMERIWRRLAPAIEPDAGWPWERAGRAWAAR